MTEEEPLRKITTITRETLVPMGVVVALGLAAAGAGAAWKSQFGEIDAAFTRVNTRLEAIERGVNSGWSRENTRRLVHEIGILNPELKLPNVDGYK